MKIFIAADHAGYELKNTLREHLTHAGHDAIDLGAKTLDPADDYPPYAYSVASRILGEEDGTAFGILICASGQGMSMAANRVNGIRAALAWSIETTSHARADDNANVLVLPAKYITPELAAEMVDVFLATDFKTDEPKYQRRLNQIEELYG